MEFWASAQVYKDAFPALNQVRLAVEPFLSAAFARSTLTTIQGKLRYVPIVMPEGMRERYPARSKLRKKERIYDCSPQLNYEVFVSGNFEGQLHEYLRGIAESGLHLTGLGATREQIAEFDAIMAHAAERILSERPDQTRHWPRPSQPGNENGRAQGPGHFCSGEPPDQAAVPNASR